MTYADALAAIAAREKKGWRLGLDRMVEFLRQAGLADALGPERPRFIHVAGTNGKGSVTAFTEAILRAHGHRTGTFMSPFVYDVRERVQVDGEPISEAEFAAITASLLPFADALEDTELGGPTEFEFKTALGFAAWQRADVDAVALEVGLGGRLDSTNVVHPAATIVVSIGLDHMAILGDTEALIAAEKAGIFKPGVPAVRGWLSEEAAAVVDARAAEVGAPLLRYGEAFALEDGHRLCTDAFTELNGLALQPGIPGARQTLNAALAALAVRSGGFELDRSVTEQAIREARLLGRMEERTDPETGVRWILDGSHNAPAAGVLAQSLYLREHPEQLGRDLVDPDGLTAAVRAWMAAAPRFVMLSGMLTGHDPATFFAPLGPGAARVVLAPIDFFRARPPAEVAAEVPLPSERVTACETLAEAVALAQDKAQAAGLPLLVAGSFYLLGDLHRAGLLPPV